MTSATAIGAGGACQSVAPLGTALAGHDAGPAEVVEDRTQELGRQALCRGQRLGGGRLPDLGQREQGTHAVVDLGGDVHTTILPLPTTACPGSPLGSLRYRPTKRRCGVAGGGTFDPGHPHPGGPKLPAEAPLGGSRRAAGVDWVGGSTMRRGVVRAVVITGAAAGATALMRSPAVRPTTRRQLRHVTRWARYESGRLEGLRYRLAGRHPDPDVYPTVLADRVRSVLGPLEHRLDIPRVHVMVEGHTVLLHGEVDDERQAWAVEDAVRRRPGRGPPAQPHRHRADPW